MLSALYSERAGQGEPVVLLHAGVADCRMWDPQVDSFAQAFQVIRFDAQGFGRSPAAAEPPPRADDLHRLLVSLGVSRAHLVGASMGGATAVDFAVSHPEMVGAMVLVGSGLSGFWAADPWLDAQNAAEDAAVARGDLDAATEIDLQTWLAGPHRLLQDLDPGLRAFAGPMAREVIAYDAERKPTPPIDPPAAGRLDAIAAPTLVMVGDADVARVLATADVLTRGIADCRKLVFSRAAHLLSVEHPDEFNAAVLDFLRAGAWGRVGGGRQCASGSASRAPTCPEK